MKKYKIIRFHKNRDPEIMMIGLTIEEAKEHCSREDTHGSDWFDGFTVQ